MKLSDYEFSFHIDLIIGKLYTEQKNSQGLSLESGMHLCKKTSPSDVFLMEINVSILVCILVSFECRYLDSVIFWYTSNLHF